MGCVRDTGALAHARAPVSFYYCPAHAPLFVVAAASPDDVPLRQLALHHHLHHVVDYLLLPCVAVAGIAGGIAFAVLRRIKRKLSSPA